VRAPLHASSFFHLNINQSSLKDQIALNEPGNNKKNQSEKTKKLLDTWFNFFYLKGKLVILLYLKNEKT
jgi:hypothetical protein